MHELSRSPGGITREGTRAMMGDFLKEKMKMTVPHGLDDDRIDTMVEAIMGGDMMGLLRAALGGLVGV